MAKQKVEIKVIRAHERQVEVSSGRMTRLAGVSQELVGAKGIHLAVATVPPGCESSAHHHVNCESAIYITRGRGKMLVGDSLEKALDIGPGDFIYVPPMAVHQPVNDSKTEPLEMIVARNSPVEIVEEYKPAAGKAAKKH